jgi:hypothetical protein
MDRPRLATIHTDRVWKICSAGTSKTAIKRQLQIDHLS